MGNVGVTETSVDGGRVRQEDESGKGGSIGEEAGCRIISDDSWFNEGIG